MKRLLRASLWIVAPVVLVLVALVLWGGFATRPINPPLPRTYVREGMQFERLEHNRGDQQDLVVLAFSGGGTRAAAFSYGALETLRRIEVPTTTGRTVRLLDEVDVITGISGGSFTALSYGLYGESCSMNTKTVSSHATCKASCSIAPRTPCTGAP